MLVFDARSVLLLEDVYFSASNMQSGAVEMCTPEFFSSIPFEKVYHEGGIGWDTSIISHRCAEVLAPSPMPLDEHLRWIYCRSEAERTTLLQALGPNRMKWERRIKVSDDLRVFEKRFTFVESVSLNKDGLIFRLNPRSDHRPVAVQIDVRDLGGAQRILVSRGSLPSVPPNALAWQVRGELVPGVYNVSIKLEEHQAFNATLKLDDIPF